MQIEKIKKRYPKAKARVSDIWVNENIPNFRSIEASLFEYTILPGIREVISSDFSSDYDSLSRKDKEYIQKIAWRIEESEEIDPLIVVIDDEGPYILEGSHRIEALYILGKKTFPALVVIDQSE